MKKAIIAILVLVLVAGAVFAQQRLRNGSYTATADGYEGPLTVTVTVSRARISAITISEHSDTQAYVTMVTNTMIPAMIEAQSAEVDALAGATGTSNGVKQAVQDAIDQARR